MLTPLLIFLFLTILGVGTWAIVASFRNSQNAAPLLKPQHLSALALPYRTYMGEAVAIHSDVLKQAKSAPKTLQPELLRLAGRVEALIQRALPRAEHGTNLSAYLLELSPNEPQHAATKASAEKVAAELEAFVGDLRELRGKVYQVLTDATDLSKDQYLAQDLQDALIEIGALEEAFGELEPPS